MALFLAALIAISAPFYLYAWLSPNSVRNWGRISPLFMWTPGLAAFVTMAVRGVHLRQLGWRLGPPQHLAMAYLIAFGVCAITYGAAWTFGWSELNIEALEAARGQAGLPSGLFGIIALMFLVALVAPVGIVASLGEEIGWRGFLAPRLVALLGLRRSSLVVGVIWFLWHLPVVARVLPAYLPTLPLWYATLCFGLSVATMSVIHTWLRMTSCSFWPSALLHGSGNSFLSLFESVNQHTEITPFITHEFGAGLAILMTAIALPFWARLREMEEKNRIAGS